MMPNWTKQQEQAIRARNHTILVSAAAGSGKTAVLVERIVSLVREGASMNRMLIVTFTKAAAAEMRQRLAKRISREAISREPAMVKALDELETTQISIDSRILPARHPQPFRAGGRRPACPRVRRTAAETAL